MTAQQQLINEIIKSLAEVARRIDITLADNGVKTIRECIGKLQDLQSLQEPTEEIKYEGDYKKSMGIVD